MMNSRTAYPFTQCNRLPKEQKNRQKKAAGGIVTVKVLKRSRRDNNFPRAR